MRNLYAFGLFLVVVMFSGCGDGHATLKATVTLDGQPLAAGAVLLVKTDAELAREGAVIKDGAFTTALKPGKYRVEINARKVVGKEFVESAGQKIEADVTAEAIPEWYNTNTELTVHIVPGSNEAKFDLTSKR